VLVRMTHRLQELLTTLLEEGSLHGYALISRLGVLSRGLYPILPQLEPVGWILSRDRIEPAMVRRRSRRRKRTSNSPGSSAQRCLTFSMRTEAGRAASVVPLADRLSWAIPALAPRFRSMGLAGSR
jgi:hypothetical protein